MKHYLFEDEATGEEFIVGEYCLEKKLDYFAKLNAEINKIIEGK